MFLILLLGCNLLDKIGAKDCEEYCQTLIDKADACAQERYDEACASGDTAICNDDANAIGDWVSSVKPDWADQGADEMVDSCNSEIASSKTEAECLAETAAINNLTCDQILTTVEAVGG